MSHMSELLLESPSMRDKEQGANNQERPTKEKLLRLLLKAKKGLVFSILKEFLSE